MLPLRPKVVRPPWRPAAALLLALLASGAAAHEVVHEVRGGKAVAVRAHHADGEVLAGALFEVYSPTAPGTPHQTGKTDRNGWLSFVPDAPGSWRIRILDDEGHGLDLRVDPGTVLAAPAEARPTNSLAAVLRPVGALLALGAIFGGLHLSHRRRADRRG